jgi:hypothetical protein
MDSVFGYKILPEQKLLLQYFKGMVNIDVTIASLSKLSNDNSFNSSFNSIVDFRDAFLQFEEKDAAKFIEFLQKQNIFNPNKKIAFLTDTPNQVVLLTLFSAFAQNFNLLNKIFSTLEISLHWIPIDENDKSLIINEFSLLKKFSGPL